MTKERLYLFDTTLRDGAQTTGVDFSLADKRNIAAMLDGLGIDYIEGGYPGANVTDSEFFRKKPKMAAKFCAFGMTKRAGRSAANDPGIAGLLEADADCIVYVAKSWDYQVHVALEIPLADNVEGITDSVAYAAARRREVVALAERAQVPLLEDDPYGLVRFEGEAPPSMFELSPETVIYTSSFSKTVSPGLRVGWYIFPEALARTMVDRANATYITPVQLGEA